MRALALLGAALLLISVAACQLATVATADVHESGDTGRGGFAPDAASPDRAPADRPRADLRHDDLERGDAESRDLTGDDAAILDTATADRPAALDAGRTDATPHRDAAQLDVPDDAGFVTSSRNSLSVCWLDPSCPRVFSIGHGGLWSASTAPYDSDAAIHAAYEAGMDGVKIDVRITADDVAVISHSSPLEIYESLDCTNKKIEEMTADEVTSCHRFPSSTETFQRLSDVIAYLRGKMVAQLTVKRSQDYPQAIAAILDLGAQDFTFFEISTAELRDQIPGIPGSDQVYYLINVGDTLTEVDTLIDSIANPRAFMYEFDPSPEATALIASRVHPAGIRAFTYDRSTSITVAQLVAYHHDGYDVVSTQRGHRGVTARQQVNTERGVSPP